LSTRCSDSTVCSICAVALRAMSRKVYNCDSYLTTVKEVSNLIFLQGSFWNCMRVTLPASGRSRVLWSFTGINNFRYLRVLGARPISLAPLCYNATN
jgi:hypothetical protein